MVEHHEPSSDASGSGRRVIPQRDSSWAARCADLLYRARLRPNQISLLSVVASALGALALVVSADVGNGTRALLLVVATVCIPLRLLLNMLDGMLAVEKGLHTPTGDLFNELPDRVADLLLIAAAGYATAGVATVTIGDGALDLGVLAGWLAAMLAVLTAYVRTLGTAQGVQNYFDGPMAKPPRMWVLALACVLSLLEPTVGLGRGSVLLVALVVIGAGSLATVVVRLRRIAAALHAREAGR